MPSKKAQRDYYERNRERVIERSAQWAAENRERSREHKRNSAAKSGHRARDLMRRYGMTEEDFDARLEEQGGVCAICGGEAKQVDHCHETGEVRGILCGPCNRMLGDARDDVEVLQAAIRYLVAARARSAKGVV